MHLQCATLRAASDFCYIVKRDALGIRKRREVSAAELERLKAFAFERSTRYEAGSEADICLAREIWAGVAPKERETEIAA